MAEVVKEYKLLLRERGGEPNKQCIVVTSSSQESDITKLAQIGLKKTIDTEISLYTDLQDRHEDIITAPINDAQPPEVFSTGGTLTVGQLLRQFNDPKYGPGYLFGAAPYGCVVHDTDRLSVLLLEVGCFSTRRSSACYRPSGGLPTPEGVGSKEKKPHGLDPEVSRGDLVIQGHARPISERMTSN